MKRTNTLLTILVTLPSMALSLVTTNVPPMGYNSWYDLQNDLNETNLKETVDVFSTTFVRFKNFHPIYSATHSRTIRTHREFWGTITLIWTTVGPQTAETRKRIVWLRIPRDSRTDLSRL